MKFKNTKPIKPKKQRVLKRPKKKEVNINESKKAKKFQFPSIYRKIPEKTEIFQILKILKNMAVIFIFTVILIVIGYLSIDLYKNYTSNQQIQVERQKLIREMNIWKSFGDKYKNYKEVYFQIAAREFQLGNYKSAQDYLQKSLFLDPNYEEAIKLQKELESR